MSKTQMSQSATKSAGWCETCCSYFGKGGILGRNRCHAFTSPDHICPRSDHEGVAPPCTNVSETGYSQVKRNESGEAPLCQDGDLL